MKSLMTNSEYKISIRSYDLNNHLFSIVNKRGEAFNIDLNKNEIIKLCSMIENSLNVQILNAEIP